MTTELAARGEDNIPPGMKLMKLAIEPLVKVINKAIAEGVIELIKWQIRIFSER